MMLHVEKGEIVTTIGKILKNSFQDFTIIYILRWIPTGSSIAISFKNDIKRCFSSRFLPYGGFRRTCDRCVISEHCSDCNRFSIPYRKYCTEIRYRKLSKTTPNTGFVEISAVQPMNQPLNRYAMSQRHHIPGFQGAYPLKPNL